MVVHTCDSSKERQEDRVKVFPKSIQDPVSKQQQQQKSVQSMKADDD